MEPPVPTTATPYPTPPPGDGTAWCNVCTSGCASDGCSWCGLGEFIFAFLSLGVIGVCAAVLMGVIGLAVCIKDNSRFKSNHSLAGRVFMISALVPGGVPQVVAQYYGLYHRDAMSEGEQIPPCIGSQSWIGLWTSGFGFLGTTEFLSMCTGSNEFSQIQAMRVTSTVAMAASLASCFCLVAFPSSIPGFALVGLHVILLVATVVLAETLYTVDDFCHSGQSLEGLLYDKGAAIWSTYAALVLAVAGALATAVVRVCYPHYFEPLPVPVEGHVVEVESAEPVPAGNDGQHDHEDQPVVEGVPVPTP